AGTAALGNSSDGILLYAGSTANRIGTNGDGVHDTAESNLISGNGRGILIQDTGTTLNVVAGNFIGTDVTGTTFIRNNSQGILLQSGASYNTIGTDGSNDAFNAD